MERKTPKFYLKKATEFIGKRFNRLVVIELTKERGKDRHIIVKCLCDCGNEHMVKLSLLKRGSVQSCGCLQPEKSMENLKKAQQVMFKREPRLGSAAKVYGRNYKDGDISFEEFLELTQLNCYYCGAEPSNRYNAYISKEKRWTPERIKNGYFIYNGLDRVDNDLGHNKDNVVPACKDCNFAKIKRSKQEFFEWIAKIYNLHSLG